MTVYNFDYIKDEVTSKISEFLTSNYDQIKTVETTTFKNTDDFYGALLHATVYGIDLEASARVTDSAVAYKLVTAFIREIKERLELTREHSKAYFELYNEEAGHNEMKFRLGIALTK